jgi:hypothetical protein
MIMGIIGAIAGFVMSHCGFGVTHWEWWAVMGCICAAFVKGVAE